MHVSSYQKLLAVLLVCISPAPYVFAAEPASEAARSNEAEGSNPAVAVVKQIKTPRIRVVDATIEAVQQATVSAQIRGRITEISVDVDDYVEKGTVILRIRDKEQRAAVDVAKARFDEADAEYLRKKEVYVKGLVAKSALLHRPMNRLSTHKCELPTVVLWSSAMLKSVRLHVLAKN